ncbi:Molybdate-binding protein ModA [Usitatibacter rugosus]|uniref:Molybdate-binding protein ModA n=1 Tax=Usitatibacter rugosus TaxID=2732067 RepID=A0A6M4GS38_9PROT|nr:molybdate ABC transporter substrate-binding protein [Usitatibacter rugosus]QJR09294.1 Molybdate-binding protein ModA [Usitatibacter rugosus]
MKTARILLALTLSFLLPAAWAEDFTVFAAASLKEALDAQAKAFEAAKGHKAAISYAGSNALAKQIEAGAPAALFISADTDWIDYVEQKQLTVPGSRVDLLRNELVLIAPAASTTPLKIAPGFGLAMAIGNGRIAMANPDAVPAGKYGKASLTALGVWDSVAPKVAAAENVRSALALVSRGEAPFGIVYRTDAMADKGVRIVDTFPAGTHPPIVYPLVMLKTAKAGAAQEFARWLAAPEARATWERYGFLRN